MHTYHMANYEHNQVISMVDKVRNITGMLGERHHPESIFSMVSLSVCMLASFPSQI